MSEWNSIAGADHTATEAAVVVPNTSVDSSFDQLMRQKALAAFGRRAAAPPECSILLHDAAELIAATLGVELSLVGELVDDATALELRLHELALQGTQPLGGGRVTTAGGESLAGYVLETAHPTAVESLAAEDRFCDELLRRHGVQSAVAAPLKLQDRAYGALAACTRRPHRFNEEDLLFVETVAHLVATTVARSQTEQWLSIERRLADGVIDSLDALVLILDGKGRVMRSNPACRRVTGFAQSEICGRTLWDTLCVPEEAKMLRGAFERLLNQQGEAELACRLLTKQAERRHVAWTLAAVCDSGGRMDSVVATGIDVTRERELEARVRRLEQADKAASAGGPPPINIERRRRPRRSYPFPQMVAPMRGDRLPGSEEFFFVTCNDISVEGFSFLTPRPFPAEALVVALGTPSKLTYLTAQIVHVNRAQHRGQLVYMVGARYSGRARYEVPAAPTPTTAGCA